MDPRHCEDSVRTQFLPWPNHVNWGFPVTSVGNSRTTTRPERGALPLRISRRKGSFFETSACPRFCKRRVPFCTQVRSMGASHPYKYNYIHIIQLSTNRSRDCIFHNNVVSQRNKKDWNYRRTIGLGD